MGGKAFQHLSPTAIFPRLPSVVYQSLKARLLPCVQQFYELVAVPAEAPEKTDHGDLDFVVARPRASPGSDTLVFVSHDKLKDALGALWALPADGNRTSNYAVPLPKGEEVIKEKEEEGTIDQEQFLQVDVHVCADAEEWERVVFFHGYGDLGMIVGSLARPYGLSVGTKGLKITNPLPLLEPFHVASSPESILLFYGLSMDAWKAGFATQQDAFEWVASSRLFDPARIEEPKDSTAVPEKKNARRRQREGRGMYQAFLTWARAQPQPHRPDNDGAENVIADALEHFKKRTEFDALVLAVERRRRAKEMWNGNVVREWTGLTNWRDVGRVMRAVREGVGGEEQVGGLEEEELRKLVGECAAELEQKVAIEGVIEGVKGVRVGSEDGSGGHVK